MIDYQNIILRLFDKLPEGALILEMPDGDRLILGDREAVPSAHIQVTDATFFKRMAWDGDIGIAEAYMEGMWQSANPAAFIGWLLKNHKHLPQSGRLASFAGHVRSLIERARHALRANTLSGSKRNIMEHYDLGNAFYEQFLDSSMTYSSAFFKCEGDTLEEAQREKYDRLCRALGLRAGMSVLEIGCGWGGFAEHAARHYGCRVRGITLSPAQLEYAQKRIQHAKLEGRVTLELCDYREAKGQYDAIVSIEMIEAVGHRYLSSFVEQCDALLKPGGALALQVITCADSRYESYRKGSDFIRKHVFPGGHLPSLQALHNAFAERTSLEPVAMDSFGQHYAETLRRWRQRFEENWKHIQPLGFDTRFKRLWRMYLAYCEAAFDTRHINLVQCVFARPNEQGIPCERVEQDAVNASARALLNAENLEKILS